MRWNQGRAAIDRLIADGELQRVPPSREHADQLLAQARRDLASAEILRGSNPKRAYESLYDAARMALTAVLENQGLRANHSWWSHRTVRGRHGPARSAIGRGTEAI